MREKTRRIHGPYKHGNRWRVVDARADGSAVVESFATFDEAQAVVDAARSQIQGFTLTLAVQAYEQSMIDRSLSSKSADRQRRHLDKLLQLEKNGHRALAWLTPARADTLYRALTTEPMARGKKVFAVDTHRSSLAAARRFFRWCIRKGWASVNPFVKVEGIGKHKRGKPQLRLEESHKLIATCLEERSRESVAVMTLLLLGIRASEATDRKVRDLDDEGRLYWIDKAKTPSGRRCLEVPDVLRPALLELAKDRPAGSYLFGATDLERPSHKWIHYHCKRLCAKASVPIVTPHGLRGTFTTIATRASAVSHEVAAQLGHASYNVTKQHYIAPGALEQTTRQAAVGKLVSFSPAAVTKPTKDKPSR